MGKIIIKEQTAADTPSSGNVVIYPKTDGRLYSKNDEGIERDLSSTGISESIINAKGDLIVGSADDTATILPTPTLTTGDGNRILGVKDTADDTLVWLKDKHNGIDLNYVNAATYTISYHDDHIIVGVYSADMTFTFADPTYFPTTGKGKEYIFKNGDTTGKVMIVKLYGTGVFQNGLNELKIYNRQTVRIGMVRPNIADGALLLSRYKVCAQIRRSTTWDASNFTSVTAIPFDTNDVYQDSNVIEHSTSTNTSRITIPVKTKLKFTFWFSVDSTGGSASWAMSGYLRKNGTTVVDGSNFDVGNYKTEDSHVSVGPIIVDSDGDDYFEIVVEQSALTGNIHDAVVNVLTEL